MDEAELRHWMHIAAARAVASAQTAFTSLIDGCSARIAEKTVTVEVWPAQNDGTQVANCNARKRHILLAISSPLRPSGLHTMTLLRPCCFGTVFLWSMHGMFCIVYLPRWRHGSARGGGSGQVRTERLVLPEDHPLRMSARLDGAIAAVREGRREDAVSMLDSVQEDEERSLAEAIPACRRPVPQLPLTRTLCPVHEQDAGRHAAGCPLVAHSLRYGVLTGVEP